MEKIEGIIVVYKEKGCTSHDVVDRVRKIVGTKKVGHTGTLDPDACGVLPVCIGRATKIASYITEKEKEYIATMRFGIVTDTQDMSGNVVNETQDFTLDEAEVRKVINSFVGEIMQIPPIYSAVKVKGKRLYEYARSGETVKIPSRKVLIKEIEILEINEKTAKIRVVCGAGTYIRSLCHDIGKKLGVGATMEELTRVKTGMFEEKDSVTLDKLQELMKNKAIDEALLKTDYVFTSYPRFNVTEESFKKLVNGNKLLPSDTHEGNKVKIEDTLYTVYYNDEFYALYKGVKEEGKWILKIEKMFNISED